MKVLYYIVSIQITTTYYKNLRVVFKNVSFIKKKTKNKNKHLICYKGNI